MTIFIEKDDLTKISCDAIVNPANSFGYMGGGAAGAIKKVGGAIIEKEAISKSPIPIGKAIVTTSGSLPCKFVIHAPTMSKPALSIDVNNVKLATRAAFDLAFKLKLKSIAIPGMGTGVGRVPHSDAAKVIIKIAKEFENKFDKIILIDKNNEMIKSFHQFLK